jgi:hypothetical protein
VCIVEQRRRVAHHEEAELGASEGDVHTPDVRKEANAFPRVSSYAGEDDDILLAPLESVL